MKLKTVLTTFQTLDDISWYSSDNHIIVHHLEGSQGKGQDFLKAPFESA